MISILGNLTEVRPDEVCAVCGEPFDVTHGNLLPMWSDGHDAAVHWICQGVSDDNG